MEALQYGARCDICPLALSNGGGPVYGSGSFEASLLLCGEAPGSNEVKQKKPFVGNSGKFLSAAFKRNRVDRSEARITNALLCKPPNDMRLADYLDNLPAGTLSPLLCCRERLLRELHHANTIFAIGGAALSALADVSGGILKWRGSPLRVTIPAPADANLYDPCDLDYPRAPADDGRNFLLPGERWLIPTIHPAATMRDGEYRKFERTVHADFDKGLRIWRNGKSEWDETTIHPLPATIELLDVIQRMRVAQQVVAVDIETNGGHVLDTLIRCVGFAWNNGERDEAWVANFRTLADELWPYAQEWERSAVFDAVCGLLADERVPKLFHHGLYDTVALDNSGMPVRGPIHDTLYKHHAWYSELPHNLGFVGSVCTDSRFWKDDIKDTGKEDHRLTTDQKKYNTYNCRDTLVTLRSDRKMADEPEFRAQYHIYKHSLQLMPIAKAMQERGMLFDRVRAAEVREKLLAQEAACVVRLRDILRSTDYAARGCGEVDEFIPSGQFAIRAALQALGIPLTERTKSGKLLKVDANTLATVAPYCSQQAREFISLLIRNAKGDDIDPSTLGWRTCSKLRTTYIEKPPILEDGRIHATWKIHGTISGRFSTEPNVQNWPVFLRSCIIAPDGYVFIGPDYSQIEMRVQAYLSGDQVLLDSFKTSDSHTARASMLFEVAYEAVTYHQRLLSKRYIYQLSYNGTDEGIYQKLLPEYPGLTLTMVQEVGRKIKKLYRHWMEWRAEVQQRTKARGYGESAILRRRRYFLGGMKATEIANYPVQSTAADVINLSMIALRPIVAADWPDVYLINQCHDSLLFEVPEGKADAFKKMLAEVLPGPFNLIGCGQREFPAKISVGRTWDKA